MQGKQVLITGGTAGIGKAAATALAAMGASVTILGRNAAHNQAAVDEIRRLSGSQAVDSLACELGSLKSVREAAGQFKPAKLDVLVMNAGVFLPKRQLNEDGIEQTFASRFLGHFLLSQLLLPKLQAAGEARIITTGAPPNSFKVHFDDLNSEKSYSTFKAVMNGAGCLLMYTLDLAKRYQGKGITANFFHPGVIKTGLMSQMPLPMRLALNLFGGSPKKGADTMVYLASAPELKGITGQFFHKRKSKPFKGQVTNQADWAKAWEVGMKMTGLA